MPINSFLKFLSQKVGEATTSAEVNIDGHWMRLHLAIERIGDYRNASELVPLFTHYNGYIREAAISQSSTLDDTSFIPCLIERLNDWVPQVRLAARNALKLRLVPENVPLFVSLSPDLAKLHYRSRDNHGVILAEIHEFIRRPENLPFVVKGLHSSDIKVARECFRLLLGTNGLSPHDLAYYALRSKDLVVAMEAIRLIAALPEADRLAAIETGLRSPFSSLKAAMLLSLLRSASSRKRAFTEAMLFDRHQTVREIACTWLEGQGDEIKQRYLATLNLNQPAYKIRCALWAVGKYRIQDAVPIVRSLLDASSSKVRSAAILTCAKLNPESANEMLEVALKDTWPGTNKVAVQLVRLYGACVPHAQLLRLLETPERVVVATRIAREAGKWLWLFIVLEAFLLWRNRNDVLVSHIASDIGTWLEMDKQDYSNPSQAYVDLIKVQLHRGALDGLERSVRERLAFILQCSGIQI